MNHTHIVGIDPGLVHTGVVHMHFDRVDRVLTNRRLVVEGVQPLEILEWLVANKLSADAIFIEGYRPRSNYGTDTKMLEAVKDYKNTLRNTVVLQNMGVKKIIKQDLMELLSVWTFSTTTNHQDLRSAARIALLGMVKNAQYNEVLSYFVSSHLLGSPWDVLNL